MRKRHADSHLAALSVAASTSWKPAAAAIPITAASGALPTRAILAVLDGADGEPVLPCPGAVGGAPSRFERPRLELGRWPEDEDFRA